VYPSFFQWSVSEGAVDAKESVTVLLLLFVIVYAPGESGIVYFTSHGSELVTLRAESGIAGL